MNDVFADVFSTDFLELLPAPLKADETMRAAARALSAQLNRFALDTPKARIYERLDGLSDGRLAAMAYDFHVDFYDPDAPRAARVRLVKNSFRYHKRKATKAAVEGLIADVYGAGEAVEWFEYGGEPYHYIIRVSGGETLPDWRGAKYFVRVLNSVTRLTAVLDRIENTVPSEGTEFFGSAARTSGRIWPETVGG
jgi:P2-related tail formation protein